VLEALGPKLNGLQARVETCIGKAPPVTVPPVAEIETAVPSGKAPRVLVTPIGVLVAPTAIVRLTTARVPFGMMLAFMPAAIHVYDPEPPKQVTVLPAPEATDPTTAEIAVTLLAG